MRSIQNIKDIMEAVGNSGENLGLMWTIGDCLKIIEAKDKALNYYRKSDDYEIAKQAYLVGR